MSARGRLILLAHRGWWSNASERNTLGAIERAFAACMGVETDVRDFDGELVLSHDMPRADQIVPFDRVLELFAKYDCPGGLAINIKADGLHAPLQQAIDRLRLKRVFVFDMSVPDARGYIARGIPSFTRQSEMEPQPAFYEAACGIWLDCFERDWIDADVIRQHLRSGKQVALVSPELHGRDPRQAWTEWRAVVGEAELLLCTDMPDLALRTFHIDRAFSSCM